MNKIMIPPNYRPPLDIYGTQRAIDFVKRTFQKKLSAALNLKRVSAPLFVDERSGLNDNLNGYERPVGFDIPAVGGNGQVVQSLAKWKRLALKRYDFYVGKGLYTDMNAIRRDEDLDNIHSIYVDQWDWEKVIRREDRCEQYLRDTVISIVNAICDTQAELLSEFPELTVKPLDREISFVTSQELEDIYPQLTPSEREAAYVRGHGTTFVMQIGDVLRSGQKHDGRAPDYDDWSLNGDIIFWNDVLQRQFEVSSMGIRVDAASLDAQLKKTGCDDRRNLPFHRMLLNDELPLTVGGGIGQSRLCMLLLGTAHIGEVQASLWDSETRVACDAAGIMLL